MKEPIQTFQIDRITEKFPNQFQFAGTNEHERSIGK